MVAFAAAARRSGAGAQAWRNDSVDAAGGDDVDVHAAVLAQEDDAASDGLTAVGHRAERYAWSSPTLLDGVFAAAHTEELYVYTYLYVTIVRQLSMG